MVEENASGDVIDQQAEDQNVGESGDQVSGDGVTVDSQPKPQDDYYKNKAFEFERKYKKTEEQLSKIEEMIRNQQENSNQTPQYSEDQLRAALSSDSLTPEQASFARSELQKLENKKWEERDKRIVEQVRKENQDQLTRQQAEQQVLSDPRFQEAFVKLPNGQVQWKQDSQLAQMIGAYMNDPRLSNQPDAISIAAKLAYADMTATQKQQELQKIKRQNEQLKGQTMVEGGGRNYNKPSTDSFRESMQTLKSRPFDKKAGVSAVKEYLLRRNAVKK